jgi:hypothetical protein
VKGFENVVFCNLICAEMAARHYGVVLMGESNHHDGETLLFFGEHKPRVG